MSDSLAITFTIGLIKTFVCLYDAITFPIYAIINKKWKPQTLEYKARAKATQSGKFKVTEWSRTEIPPEHHLLHVDTLDDLFKKLVSIHGDKKCLGSRKTIQEEEEQQPDGRVFRKIIQTDFEWLSFHEVDKRIDNVARGLYLYGLRAGNPIMLFAETQIEWYISAQAVFRLGGHIATLYPTLGDESIVHAINETEVAYLITTYDLLPKVEKLAKQFKYLKHIIFIEGFKRASLSGFNSIEVIPFSQLEIKGSTSKEINYDQKGPNDTAIIMYTSGSTGVPKGVLITHKNVLSTIKGFYSVAHSLSSKHVYMAYLPLAHVLELAAECFFLSLGFAIGYSSPHTMTDKSTAVKKGQKGDATILQPTVIASVPLVLDRIKKTINQQIDAKGPFFSEFFKFAMEYKSYWNKRGFKCPLINRIICKKIRALLGGKIEYIVCGSAPLAPDTHEFIRTCLDVTLITGYGLTETAAGATLMDFDDLSVGRVGPPLYGLSIKLNDWKEGNYFTTDKPYPRGELLISGGCVSSGYFKNDALTRQYFVEEDGKRWFHTGDIAEIHDDGSVKLIDRKKDLIKLSAGEYVSLGKIETELKLCPIVDNICVYGDSYHTYVIAIIVPNEKELAALSEKLDKHYLSHKERCKDPKVLDAVKKMLLERASQVGLHRTEVPAKVLLVEEEWTPDSGLVTAALKIRRNNIKARYLEEIDRLYSCNSNGVQSA